MTTLATSRVTAGQLNQRVVLQKRGSTQDALGQAASPWLDVGPVWCRARPLRTREIVAAGQTQVISDVSFVIRWRCDVLNTWRLVWQDVPYEITGAPIDIDGERQWLELSCTTGVRDGR